MNQAHLTLIMVIMVTVLVNRYITILTLYSVYISSKGQTGYLEVPGYYECLWQRVLDFWEPKTKLICSMSS